MRQRLAYEHPLWFSMLYLRHHFDHPLAPFHIEMFHLIRQKEYDFMAVMAFRESGKSTILNTANALWSILGRPDKKFVIIMSKTQEQAKNHFTNIKTELENNESLKNDFGPFAENEDDLKRLSLELTYHGSKIMSVTREQSIRGLKYGQYRPDLIICDDLEDISSLFDEKESDMLFERFEKEVVPVGSSGTRIIVLGNLIGKDSFMMRLKNSIQTGEMPGLFRVYPLIDDNGKNLWPGKFPDKEAERKLYSKISRETWAREYLLSFEDSTYHDIDTPDHLDENEKDDHVITKWYLRKLAEILRRRRNDLNDAGPQVSLIEQMGEFKISLPTLESFIEPEPGDIKYDKYQEFKIEEKNLDEEYLRALKRALRIRADEQARREGEI